jgi:hypothetical protein
MPQDPIGGFMYLLTEPLENLALYHFDAMDVDKGDWFFSTFGPGNVINATDRPHERFSDYETLLHKISLRDKTKYDQIHKGTAFYFLTWLAFDLKNYEKGLYYVDAAISEDVKNGGPNWANLPGAAFLKLEYANQVAGRVIEPIKKLLNTQIERFNGISGQQSVNINDFINKFVVPFIQDPPTRTIISAFYVYLLEFEDRLSELTLRSTQGCSIGPIISHFFNGCIIFESLLKKLYPLMDNGSSVKTLGNIFHTQAFIDDFGEGIDTHATSLQVILDNIPDDTITTAFTVTSRLRNTTGYNLIWDNIFENIEHFRLLTHQVINSLFYVIEKKFLR